ncbi:Lrp/AsnC family transcriptional regulator [Microbispora siamensis]|uniref:AsnC family transcriptional regulator n=1 Tax=Microbispora siamensis TaxID=564413 RepID=A0ABQ4GRT3_9ACTN|nr:Lrp/AsnC family transcriptional regulator [Microbispora siamensis]GIH64060.1 AsnC family transcriptional regulator [Microbispora siamensis]
MLDELDRGLVHALHVDGRAPFSRIAEVLGVSTQTVTRRYRRLRAGAGLRVVGLPEQDRTGQAQWVVRLTTTPTASQALGHALARRPDTSWVKLASGGTEIFAIVHTEDDSRLSRSLLLHDIPRTSGITAVSAHLLLHTYLGGPTAWRGRLRTLSDEQQQALMRPAPSPGTRDQMSLTDGDRALIDALRHDGRAGYAELAAATGWSPATVARRLADLRASGTIFFDVEVDVAAYGVTAQALLWMAVTPAHLDEVATTLATHDELAVVAATTGATNLLAHALCAGPADLHRYLTRRLGTLDQIRTLETAPVLHTLKAAGHLTPVAARPGFRAPRA